MTVVRPVQSGNVKRVTLQFEVTGAFPTIRCGGSVIVPGGGSIGERRSNVPISGNLSFVSALNTDNRDEANSLDSAMAAHPLFPRPSSVSNAL